MSNDVTIDIKGDNKGLNKALKQSQSMFKSWTGAIVAGAAVIASAFAFNKLFNFAGKMIESMDAQDKAAKKLESVLRATGGAAGWSAEQLAQVASELQTLTGTGDEVVTDLQAVLATFREIKGDNFTEATKAALDMSHVLGGDLKSSAIQLGKALNDPITGMTALKRSGVTFSESQKETIRTLQEMGDIAGAQKVILEELNHEFGGAAADSMGTFAGQVKLISNRIDDLYETMGALLVPVLSIVAPLVDVVVSAFENLTVMLQASTEGAAEWSKSWGAYLVDTFKWVAQGAADLFSFFEFLWTNFSNIAERTAMAWTLSIVTFVEQIKHLFTKVAPAYFKWFVDNVGNMFQDWSNFLYTVLGNMAGNVWNFLQHIAGLLGGESVDLEFKALTDGFEATTEKLPEIAARIASDTENVLVEGISAIDDKMGRSWNDISEKNKKFVDGLFKDVEKKKIDMTPKKVASDADADALAKKTEKEAKDAEDIAKSYAEADASKKSMAGSTTGLESLAKDIQVSLAGGSEDAAKQEAANAQFEKAQKLRDSQAKSLKKIADKQDEQINAVKMAGGLA